MSPSTAFAAVVPLMSPELDVRSDLRHVVVASFLAVTATVAACADAGKGAPSAAASAMPGPSAAASPRFDEKLLALREAEQRRAPALVGEPDHASRDVDVRRAAARALARILGETSRPGLLRSLGDEDPEVVMWAAFGVGETCPFEKEEAVSALVARAVALEDAEPQRLAFEAIARAIGRCAATRSEATLVDWLGASTDRAHAAALALGDLASREKRLREDTLVALLGRAAGGVSQPPLPEAMYPFSRLDNVSPSVHERLAEVAGERARDPGGYRLFAIRALGRAREAGIPGLERVLLHRDVSFTLPERVEAVRVALRLGASGHVLLTKTLKKLELTGDALAKVGDDAILVAALLSALRESTGITGELGDLAAVTPPEGASPRASRFLSSVRCSAAKLIVGTRANDPVLTRCDLGRGSTGKRALADVLGRSPIEGASLKAFRELAQDPDVRVREAALELLATHPETQNAHDIILAALREKEPGIPTTAAEQIAKQPALAAHKPRPTKPTKGADKNAPPTTLDLPKPDPATIEALLALVERAEREHDLEMLGAVLDALGALGQRDVAGKLERLCASSYPSVREHTERALGLLAGKKRKCEPPPRADDLAPDALAPPQDTVVIVLETDAGELELSLDSERAPVTTARVVDLVKTGYYDGVIIHRVDPSFVVQFGAPFGDGYGGPPARMPLRCETSPSPFEPLSVGVALAGRDTGSSQLFVMLARHPHLDGGYPQVGQAKGPWSSVIEGDVIRKARVASR